MTKPTVSPLQSRLARFDSTPVERRVRAALSSTEPVERMWGTEVLRHDSDSIDMSRAASGLPLLVNHERGDLPIGRVESVRLDGDRLRGEFIFSEATQEARDAYALVEDGTLSDVSISYRILDWERGENDQINVTRWMPLEASVVSVPADGTVGIGRTHPELEAPMPEETNTPEAGTASIIDRAKARRQAGFKAGADAENARTSEISSNAADLARAVPALAADIEALEQECRADTSITPDRFRSLAMEMMGSGAQPAALDTTPATVRAPTVPGNSPRGLVEPGIDSSEKDRAGIELALYARAGGKVDRSEMQGNPFTTHSLIDIAELSLRRTGVDTRGLSREQIAKRAIVGANRAIEAGAATYATADFPAVLGGLVNKFLFEGYAEADITWDQWCSTGSVQDFKSFSIPRMSSFTSLPVVAENETYLDGAIGDAGETGALIKHGALLSLSWESVVNDDLSVFSRNANRMGEAAARTLDEQVYATLLASPGVGVMGPVMGDTNQLFDDTNHSNYGTAALDLAGIVATRVGMGRQTDDNPTTPALLGVQLAHILVPLELQDAAIDLAGSEWLVDVSGTAQRMNTVRNTFTVVATPRLTDVNDWFGLARRGQTFEVMFLNGQQTPTLEQDMGWSFDTMNWKVRHVFDILPVDWRGMWWNAVT